MNSDDQIETVTKLQIVSLRGGALPAGRQVIDDEAIFSSKIKGLLRRRTPRNDKKMSISTVSDYYLDILRVFCNIG